MKTQPITITQVHPLAMAKARELAAGQPDRVQILDARCVLVVNRPGWAPLRRRRAARS